METPLTAQTPAKRAPVASAASLAVQSGWAGVLGMGGFALPGLDEGGACDLEVGKGNGFALDDLSGFVALAGDQQRIARLKTLDAFMDSGGAIADLACIGDRPPDRCADGGGILRARIVVGDD